MTLFVPLNPMTKWSMSKHIIEKIWGGPSIKDISNTLHPIEHEKKMREKNLSEEHHSMLSLSVCFHAQDVDLAFQ